MTAEPLKKVSYFPGCSLATSAKENNQALVELCQKIGVELVELDDWNCCGSSSAHSVNTQLAVDLASRNLSLAPSGRPLIVACPSCLLRLRQAHLHLRSDSKARHRFYNKWQRPFDPDLNILHFFELLDGLDLLTLADVNQKKLEGLKFVPYYGCMLNRPPVMRHEKNYHGLMEKILASLGAKPVHWPHIARCCGTFLSVARPVVATTMVNRIAQGAIDSGADCIITACAMCYMNLEIRCTLKQPLPIFHFSEILSLALGTDHHKHWFSRHLVDPRPLLESKRLIG